MIRRLTFVIAMLAAAGTLSDAVAQEPAQPVLQMKPPPAPITALMFDVTLSRDLGEKRLSSTPYSISVTPGYRSSLRMGGDVPVPSTTFTPAVKDDGKETKPAQTVSSYGYRTVGTFVDLTAEAANDGQFRVSLTIDDSSLYPPDLSPATAKTLGAPAFRNFKSNNTVMLRDGQSLEYTAATDRLTGEVVRITVRLRVVK